MRQLFWSRIYVVGRKRRGSLGVPGSVTGLTRTLLHIRWSWGPIGGFVMQRTACAGTLGRYSEDLMLIAYRSSGVRHGVTP